MNNHYILLSKVSQTVTKKINNLFMERTMDDRLFAV